MKPLNLTGVRVRIAPVGADPLDPDADWTDVGTIDEGSFTFTAADPTGEPEPVVWSATLTADHVDRWTWAQWWDYRAGTGGPLIEVEPTSVVDAPVDDAPHTSAADPTHL